MKFICFWIHSCLCTDYDMTWQIAIPLQSSELAVGKPVAILGHPAHGLATFGDAEAFGDAQRWQRPMGPWNITETLKTLRWHWAKGLLRDNWGPSERNELARFAIHNSGIVVVPQFNKSNVSTLLLLASLNRYPRTRCGGKTQQTTDLISQRK